MNITSSIHRTRIFSREARLRAFFASRRHRAWRIVSPFLSYLVACWIPTREGRGRGEKDGQEEGSRGGGKGSATRAARRPKR